MKMEQLWATTVLGVLGYTLVPVATSESVSATHSYLKLMVLSQARE